MKAYICSRYRADTQEQFDKQLRLTKDVAREVALAGHVVLVPHLYYPLFLDDDVEDERAIGISHAVEMLGGCDVVFVHIGDGVSSGMEAEIEEAMKKKVELRFFRNMNELRDILKTFHKCECGKVGKHKLYGKFWCSSCVLEVI